MPNNEEDILAKLVEKQFKEEPTLEKFLEIRTKYPNIEFGMSYIGGFDHISSLKELFEEHGISQQLYAHVLDANFESINDMCILIMKDMLKEQKIKESGGTHASSRKRVMPQHLRDWLTCCILSFLSRNERNYLCTNLAALISFRLMSGTSRIEEDVASKLKKTDAVFLAARLHAQEKKYHIASLQKYLALNPALS